MILGEGTAVDLDTVTDWKTLLSTILEQYNPVDVYNCDETSPYYKLMPDRSLIVNKDDCIDDNAPVHPTDINLKNITLKFLPANTTAIIHPMNQGIIRTFKAYCRRQLVQHITKKCCGAGIPAIDLVGVDDNLPAFNEWGDNSEKILSINVVTNEDTPQNEDFEIEQPPSLPEAIKLLRRLKLLSTIHHPELHSLPS
ncbi:unnamed protein product [Rotaria sp. Silwood1]|nr:unnamed protein product [Rotaria sp. Silwood1]CAF1687651.1 unnamed protein product [Rotaria sp. Silwood1]